MTAFRLPAFVLRHKLRYNTDVMKKAFFIIGCLIILPACIGRQAVETSGTDEPAGRETPEEVGSTGKFHATDFVYGSADEIKKALEDGADINATDRDGTRPLDLVVMNCGVEKVKFLIEHGADIHARDETYGATALHHAASAGREENIRLLLERGLDVNAPDARGYTPVDYARAADLQYSKAESVLREHGGKVGNSLRAAIMDAIKENDIARVKELLARGIDIDAADASGCTPLLKSVEKDYREIALFLVNEGANVNAYDLLGRNALYFAANRGDWDLIRLLVRQGADVNGTTGWGTTVLSIVAGKGNREIVEFLIARGAKINPENSERSPLHRASGGGHEEIVKLLIAKGADVNSKSNYVYCTPLHAAVGANRKKIAEILISNGAQVNARGWKGETALDIAVKQGWEDWVQLLRKHSAKTDKEIEEENK